MTGAIGFKNFVDGDLYYLKLLINGVASTTPTIHEYADSAKASTASKGWSDIVELEKGDYVEVEVYAVLSGGAPDELVAGYTYWAGYRLVTSLGVPSTAFNELTDVDMTTIAPSDGDVAIWNATTQKWEPFDIKSYVQQQAIALG
jgi:hypothetical protein